VEAIPVKFKFVTALSLDEYLLKAQAQGLGWVEIGVQALRNFWVTCRNAASQQIKREKEFFEKHQMGPLVEVYQKLERQLKDLKGGTDFFLRIGWAGGWENKTLGSDLLAKDPDEFRELRQRFGLGKPPGMKGKWTPSKGFPLSRRLLVNQQDKPVAPLGWVLVTLEEKG
ncbi:MAG: hypothetical protein ACUVT1_14070, partial [Anaerolineae bacterium]